MVPFDAITSPWIKTAPDGRKVFFPWGAMGRGFAIASEHDYRRLNKQLTVQWVSGYLFGMLAVAFFANGYASLSFVIVAIVLVPGCCFMWRGCDIGCLDYSRRTKNSKECRR